MTIVMTILASDNARNRRRIKRAAERALAVSQSHLSRIEKACCSPSLRDRHEDDKQLLCGRKLHHVRPEATHIVNARQKLRGKSIPLI
ncbi:hypothetical protein SAMN03097723_3530 [Pantoea eucalypti]|jgi:hypothetical protein|nr:hypothetical protein SAMN03097723_3530 [Pantoea eucalypti]